MFFPVNIDNTHWCLAVVHMQAKKIQYFDSMSGSGDMYLQGLKRCVLIAGCWLLESQLVSRLSRVAPTPPPPRVRPSHPHKQNSYLADEHKDKKKADLDLSGWELMHSDPRVTPQQGNGSDCGCFASAFAYLMSEGIPFKHVRNPMHILD